MENCGHDIVSCLKCKHPCWLYQGYLELDKLADILCYQLIESECCMFEKEFCPEDTCVKVEHCIKCYKDWFTSKVKLEGNDS